jgi:hypothetical protein
MMDEEAETTKYAKIANGKNIGKKLISDSWVVTTNQGRLT